MIPRLLNDRRVDGRSGVATVERSTQLTGVGERNRPEKEEWEDFHVRKDPSMFTKSLAIVSHLPHCIALVKREATEPVSGRFPDCQGCLRRPLNHLLMAETTGRGVFVRNHLVEPVTKEVLSSALTCAFSFRCLRKRADVPPYWPRFELQLLRELDRCQFELSGRHSRLDQQRLL